MKIRILIIILIGIVLPGFSLAYQDIGLRAYDGEETIALAIEEEADLIPVEVNYTSVSNGATIIGNWSGGQIVGSIDNVIDGSTSTGWGITNGYGSGDFIVSFEEARDLNKIRVSKSGNNGWSSYLLRVNHEDGSSTLIVYGTAWLGAGHNLPPKWDEYIGDWRNVVSIFASSCMWSNCGYSTVVGADAAFHEIEAWGSTQGEPSPLRISKRGQTYGVALVDPGDPDATNIMIETSSGTKAIRKYIAIPPIMLETTYFYTGSNPTPMNETIMFVIPFPKEFATSSQWKNVIGLNYLQPLVMSPGDGQSVHIDHYVSPEDIWYTYMGYDGRPVVKGFFDKASLFAVLGSGCHSLADFTITGKMISGGSFIGETSSGSSAYTICF